MSKCVIWAGEEMGRVVEAREGGVMLMYGEISARMEDSRLGEE